MSSCASKVSYTLSQSLIVLIPVDAIASDMAKNNPIQAYRGIFDALSKMYRTEGFISLYRGALVNIFAGSLANSIFFFVYTDGKVKYNYDPKNPNSLTTVIISLRAGIVSMLMTTPFWVVKTRLALYKDHK